MDARHVLRLQTALSVDVVSAALRKHTVQPLLLLMEAEARRKAKPHGVDTGMTARSVQSQLLPGFTPLGRVYSLNKLAPVIEVGRRPGKMPPVEPIARWAKKHGINISGFVLARAIGRRGTKGLYFMRVAGDVGKGNLVTYVRKAADALHASWRV